MVSAPARCCSFQVGVYFLYFFFPLSLLYVIFWMDQERMKFQSAEYTTKDKKSNAGVFGDEFSG